MGWNSMSGLERERNKIKYKMSKLRRRRRGRRAEKSENRTTFYIEVVVVVAHFFFLPPLYTAVHGRPVVFIYNRRRSV